MTDRAGIKQISKPVLVRIIFLLVALALIVSLGVAQARAKGNTFTTNYRVDVNLTTFVPCAAAGAGEFVQLSGPLDILFVTTIDNRGGFQSKYQVQPKGIIGTGLSSGIKYQGTGMTHGTFDGTVGGTSSFMSNFKVVGQRSGGGFLVNQDVHVSTNANGVLTVSVDNYSVTCKRGGYPSYPG
jgi:hypothetical protein